MNVYCIRSSSVYACVCVRINCGSERKKKLCFSQSVCICNLYTTCLRLMPFNVEFFYSSFCTILTSLCSFFFITQSSCVLFICEFVVFFPIRKFLLCFSQRYVEYGNYNPTTTTTRIVVNVLSFI